MAKVLRMTFENAQGRAVNINLRDPVDSLNAADVNNAMDRVVSGDIFSTSGGDIVAKLRAQVIETSVETILDFS